MITLHYSNRTEALVDRLARLMDDARRNRGPLVPLDLVVPNDNMATYARFQVAERLGIASNVRVWRMRRFAAQAIEGSGHAILDREKIEDILLTLLLGGADLPDQVGRYVGGEAPGGDGDDLRRVQLASRLARLYEEYGFSRPGAGMVGGWRGDLWRLVLDEARRRQGDVTWIPVSAIEAGMIRTDRPAYVFGLSQMARAFQKFLREVGEKTDVHVFNVCPCPEFSGDLEGVAGVPRDADPDLGVEDPFGYGADDVHFALGSWARPGRETVRLLASQTGCALQPGFVDPLDGGDSLLRRVQANMVRRAPEEATCPPDGSIRLYSCPGVRREVETVAAEVWRTVVGEGLRFSDVAVILNPKDRDAYLPLVEAVFEEARGIPVNVVDVPLAGTSRVAEAASLVLGLPFGRYTRPEVLSVLVHPCVVQALGGPDTDAWMDWVRGLGIVHGADRSDHDGTYIDRDVWNWDQGVRRLALGAFMCGDRSGEVRAWQRGDDAYYPFEAGQGAAGFALAVRSLISDARFARSARHGIADWGRFMGAMIGRYVGTDGSVEERELARVRSAVRGIGQRDLGGAEVSYRVAAELALESLEGLTGWKGQHLADGVVVSTFLPMRAIPFEAVFVTGMGEGRFPAGDRRDTLDMRGEARRAGDVSPAERDRYTFLETLLCARRRLCVSWVARDEQTGDPIEPSPLVRQLEKLAGAEGAEDAPGPLVEVVPFRRHDADVDVPVDGEDLAVLPEALTERRARALGDDLRRTALGVDDAPDAFTPEAVFALAREDAWPGLADVLAIPDVPEGGDLVGEREVLPLSLAAIRRFLECPLQGAARAVLGIWDEEGDEARAMEDEPFEPPVLDEIVMLRDVFEAGCRGEDRDEAYEALMRRLAASARMPAGEMARFARGKHMGTLAGWTSCIEQEQGAPPDEVEVLRFGRAEEHLATARVHPTIDLDVSLPDGDREGRSVRVELSGRTEVLLDRPRVSLVLLQRRADGKAPYWQKVHRAMLRGYVDHLALCASGIEPDVTHECWVCVARGDDAPRLEKHEFPPLGADEASGVLASIVADMFGGVHDYLMPCEATIPWWIDMVRWSQERQGPPPDLEGRVAGLVNAWRPSFSSLWGPVPHPGRRDVPEHDAAVEMAARRLGPGWGTLVEGVTP